MGLSSKLGAGQFTATSREGAGMLKGEPSGASLHFRCPRSFRKELQITAVRCRETTASRTLHTRAVARAEDRLQPTQNPQVPGLGSEAPGDGGGGRTTTAVLPVSTCQYPPHCRGGTRASQPCALGNWRKQGRARERTPVGHPSPRHCALRWAHSSPPNPGRRYHPHPLLVERDFGARSCGTCAPP